MVGWKNLPEGPEDFPGSDYGDFRVSEDMVREGPPEGLTGQVTIKGGTGGDGPGPIQASPFPPRSINKATEEPLADDQHLKQDAGKVPMYLLPGEVLNYLQHSHRDTLQPMPEMYLFRFMEPGGPDRHHLADAFFAMLDALGLSWWEGLEAVAKVLAFGARKYRRHGWRSGMAWSRVIGAALRHLSEHQRGQELDDESKLPHAWHFLCCVMFLLSYHLTGTGDDDRYRRKTVAVGNPNATQVD